MKKGPGIQGLFSGPGDAGWRLGSSLDGTETRIDARHGAAALLGILGQLGPQAVKGGTQLRRFSRHVPEATVQGGLGDRLGKSSLVHGTKEAFECSYNARPASSVYTKLKNIFKKLQALRTHKNTYGLIFKWKTRVLDRYYSFNITPARFVTAVFSASSPAHR